MSLSSQYPSCNQIYMRCQHFKSFLSLLSACKERPVPIFHGCRFQEKNRQTCHEKGQQDLNNIRDRHSLFSACLYHPKKTSIYSSPPQVTLMVKKKNCLQTSSTVNCNGCLSSLSLALTDSWHLYYFYFAD